MAKANFKDSISGKYYHVTGFTMKVIDGRSCYLDGEGNELLGEKDVPLESLSFDPYIEADESIITTIRIGYGTNARERDMKGIREIATKHSRSPEGRHTAWKNASKELKNK